MQQVILEDVAKYINDLLKRVPELRGEMLDEIGTQLLEEVRSRIGGAGKVAGWQEKYQGSGKGWEAIRAQAKTWTKMNGAGKRYAVGYVTNALENGHVLVPGTFVKGLSPASPPPGKTPVGAKVTKKWVPGKGFYAETRGHARQVVEAAMARFERRIQEEMNK